MKKLQVLTNSELVTFRNCRALHGYTYHERLRPLVTSACLSRGTLGHAGVAAGWRIAWSRQAIADRLSLSQRVRIASDEAANTIRRMGSGEATRLLQIGASVEQQEDFSEAYDTALWCAQHYFRAQPERLDPERYVPLMIEQPLSVRLRNAAGNHINVVFEGVLDLVLFNRETNSIQIEDLKFLEKPSTIEGKLELDTQLTGYLCLLREWFESWGGMADPCMNWAYKEGPAMLHAPALLADARVSGVVGFTVVKAKVPGEPRVNKKGDVSIAACDTLPEIYEAALQLQRDERSIPISEDQDRVLAQLRNKPAWIQRHEFVRSDEELQRWAAEVEIEATEIRRTGRQPELRTRNPGHCTGVASMPCAHRFVCRENSDTVREMYYRIADEAHEEVAAARAQGVEEHGSEESEFGF